MLEVQEADSNPRFALQRAYALSKRMREPNVTSREMLRAELESDLADAAKANYVAAFLLASQEAERGQLNIGALGDGIFAKAGFTSGSYLNGVLTLNRYIACCAVTVVREIEKSSGPTASSKFQASLLLLERAAEFGSSDALLAVANLVLDAPDEGGPAPAVVTNVLARLYAFDRPGRKSDDMREALRIVRARLEASKWQALVFGCQEGCCRC